MSIKNRVYSALDVLCPKAVKNKCLEFISSSIPIAFGVELTNMCNGRCNFCAYDHQNRKKGIMDDKVFKKAIDEYSIIGGGSINFTPTVGDPLLDMDLIKKIRYAINKKNIDNIWFYTNLISLDKFDVDELLSSGLSMLRISTCIKDRKTYQEIYGVDQYNAVLRNIVKVCERNEQLKRPVNIKLYLRNPQPCEEALNSEDFRMISQYFDKKDLHIKDYKYDSWSGKIKDIDLPTGNVIHQHNYDIMEEPCSELFRRIHVLYDGSVIFCVCRDLHGELKIGNIFEQGILDIWRGEKLKLLRLDWKRGNIPELCKSCERYHPTSSFYNEQHKNLINKYIRYKFMN